VIRVRETLLDWRRRSLPFEAVIGNEHEFPASRARALAWLATRAGLPPAPALFAEPAHTDENGVLAEILGARREVSAEELAGRAWFWIHHDAAGARTAGVAVAERLLRRFEISKRFPAAYTAGWKSPATGESWTALSLAGLAWLELWRRDDDVRRLNAALNAAMFLLARQTRSGAQAGALVNGHRLPETRHDVTATARYVELAAGVEAALRRIDGGDAG
jgi:hypothetical protein